MGFRGIVSYNYFNRTIESGRIAMSFPPASLAFKTRIFCSDALTLFQLVSFTVMEVPLVFIPPVSPADVLSRINQICLKRLNQDSCPTKSPLSHVCLPREPSKASVMWFFSGYCILSLSLRASSTWRVINWTTTSPNSLATLQIPFNYLGIHGSGFKSPFRIISHLLWSTFVCSKRCGV